METWGSLFQKQGKVSPLLHSLSLGLPWRLYLLCAVTALGHKDTHRMRATLTGTQGFPCSSARRLTCDHPHVQALGAVSAVAGWLGDGLGDQVFLSNVGRWRVVGSRMSQGSKPQHILRYPTDFTYKLQIQR